MHGSVEGPLDMGGVSQKDWHLGDKAWMINTSWFVAMAEISYLKQGELVGGDWNMTGLFSHICGIIIPIDYFSEGFKQPTREYRGTLRVS